MDGTEQERRALADAHRGEVIPGSGSAIEPWRRRVDFDCSPEDERSVRRVRMVKVEETEANKW